MKLSTALCAIFGATALFVLATEAASAHSAEYCTVHPSECPHDPHAMKGQADGVVGIRCPKGQVLTVNVATGEKVCVDKNTTAKGTGASQNPNPP